MDYTPNDPQKYSNNFHFRNQNKNNDIIQNNLNEQQINYNRQIFPQRQSDLVNDKEFLELKRKKIKQQEFEEYQNLIKEKQNLENPKRFETMPSQYPTSYYQNNIYPNENINYNMNNIPTTINDTINNNNNIYSNENINYNIPNRLINNINNNIPTTINNNINNHFPQINNNENLNSMKGIKNLYEQGRINQRGLSHGYNILTGEIYNQNLSKKEETNNLNPRKEYNQLYTNNYQINNYENLPPRKIENIQNLQYNYPIGNYDNRINNDINKPLTENEYKNFNNYIEKLNQNRNEQYQNHLYQNNPNEININKQNENTENLPLYKQYPAGFNPKKHPDMFNKKQINNLNSQINNNYNTEINNYKYQNQNIEKINQDNNFQNLNIENYKDDPFDNSALAKARRQREYKESLDAQINRKKEYDRNGDILYSQNNIYKEKKRQYENIKFNPYSQKNYSIGDKSNLSSNPITGEYEIGDRRRMMSGRLQNNGNKIIG